MIKRYLQFINEKFNYDEKTFMFNDYVEYLTKEIININLIQDMIDISIDFLDQGYSLIYNLSVINADGVEFGIFDTKVEHSNIDKPFMSSYKDGDIYFNTTRVTDIIEILNSSKYKLVYVFAIVEYDDEFEGTEMKMDESRELYQRLSSIYPNEKIDISDPY